MIKITNNMKDFIEVQKGPLLVYGAGNNGYHVGNFLNRCEIEWNGYIDQKIFPQGITFNGHRIWSKDEFVVECGNGSAIRLLITPVNYQGILEELLWLDHKYDINVLCLVPVYEDIIKHKEQYNINKCLAYFRNKLFVRDTPTIISNDCTGGMIYHAMDMMMLSPTVNIGLSPFDFIKFCRNTRYYLNQEMKNDSLYLVKGAYETDSDPLLCAHISDIAIQFAHMKPNDRPVDRWNMMRKKINWNHVIYVMREHNAYDFSIPLEIKKEFIELKNKKIFYSTKSSMYCDGVSGFYTPSNFMFDRDTPIETCFNLLEWLNE